jgi:hypothetical protein
MNTEQIFKDALQELDELIIKHREKMIHAELKHGKESEQYLQHRDLIRGFNLRIRQTKYLAQKFGSFF